jgi:hypothetical protein
LHCECCILRIYAYNLYSKIFTVKYRNISRFVSCCYGFLNAFSDIYLALYKLLLLLALQLCQSKLVKNLHIQCTAVFNGWVWLKVFRTNLFMDLKLVLLESFGNNGFLQWKWRNENKSNLWKMNLRKQLKELFLSSPFSGGCMV